MSRASTVGTHPDREKIESDLIAGKNVMQIAAYSGMSLDSLYRRRRQLLAEAEQAKTVSDDLTRIGIARRLQALAASHRQSRLEAAEAGQTRLATDAGAAERRALIELLRLSPEVSQISNETEAEREASAYAGALVSVLKTANSSSLMTLAANTLRDEGISDEHTRPLEAAAERLKKSGK